jgi:transposase
MPMARKIRRNRPKIIAGRKRGNNKIPAELTVQREERAWDLKARGYRTVEIVELLVKEFGQPITRRGVDLALQRVGEEFAKRAAAHVDDYKGRQLAALEAIHEEAMDSYRQSKGEITRKRAKQETAAKGKGRGAAPARSSLQVDTEHSAGDPRFLGTAIDALRDQRKILGIDAPMKVAMSAPERDLPPEALDARIRELQAAIAAAEQRGEAPA